MKRRIYLFSLLIIAAAGLFVTGAELARNDSDERNPTVPERWIGTWEVTVDYRDRQTGALLASDVSTNEICPGDPIVPPQLAAYVRCSNAAAKGDLTISCHNWHRMIEPGCNALGNVEFKSTLDGDSWTGSGNWSGNLVGKCIQANYVEDFVVSGKRISPKVSCDRGSSSLVEKFFLHSRLVPFLGGSN